MSGRLAIGDGAATATFGWRPADDAAHRLSLGARSLGTTRWPVLPARWSLGIQQAPETEKIEEGKAREARQQARSLIEPLLLSLPFPLKVRRRGSAHSGLVEITGTGVARDQVLVNNPDEASRMQADELQCWRRLVKE